MYHFAFLTVTSGTDSGTLVVTSSERDDVDGWRPPLGPAQTLAFVDDDHAVSLDALGPQHVVRFGIGDDGRAEWLLWGGRRAVRV